MTHVFAMLVALVVHDEASLRTDATLSSPKKAILYAGDWLEVRGEVGDFLSVYDHRRERPGYIKNWLVRRFKLEAASAPALRTLALYHQPSPGQESLGIGFAALYLRSADAKSLDGDVVVALATMADRLAERSNGKGYQRGDKTLPHHLDVVRSYGVGYSIESGPDGSSLTCYDGEAYRRALNTSLSPTSRALAIVGATAQRCEGANTPDVALASASKRLRQLQSVDQKAISVSAANRVRLRLAEVAAKISYDYARRGQKRKAADASEQAFESLASVERGKLNQGWRRRYQEVAIRVGASKWARLPERRLPPWLVVTKQEDGSQCIVIRRQGQKRFRRCSFGIVWERSIRRSRDGRSIAIAVQPLPSWVELWVLRRDNTGWTSNVLVPSTAGVGAGYVEWAGYSRDSKRLLVVREAATEKHTLRLFQALSLPSLHVDIQASSLTRFATFRRHQDDEWRKTTIALR